VSRESKFEQLPGERKAGPEARASRLSEMARKRSVEHTTKTEAVEEEEEEE